MDLPQQTAQIFERLSKGKFISENSPHQDMRELYELMENEVIFEQLYVYFSQIGFYLEKGKGHFFFVRKERNTDFKRKLDQTYKWLDVMSFFQTYDSSFGVGYRFTPQEVAAHLNTNADLKTQLKSLERYMRKKTFNQQDTIYEAIDILEKENFVALEDEDSQSYKVLSSYAYLQELMRMITISENTSHEIPE